MLKVNVEGMSACLLELNPQVSLLVVIFHKEKEIYWISENRLSIALRVDRKMIQNLVTQIYVREGNGTPLQYSCLENPMDGGAW